MEINLERVILEEINVSPKSLSEFYKRLKATKKFNKSIQALFKQLNLLVNDGKIIRKGKKYLISKQWVLDNKRFFDYSYQRISKLDTKTASLDKNYEEYHFMSIVEMDNFWNDAINQIVTNSKTKKLYVKSNYYWWFFLNMNEELNVWGDLKKNGIEIIFIITKNNQINKWASKVLNDNGFKCKIIEDNKEDIYVDWNIFSDTLIQVSYDKNAEKLIKDIFDNHKFIEDIDGKKLAELAIFKGNFQLKIIKDQALANLLKRDFNTF